MDYFEPQVLLEKITHMETDKADEYFLHAVTYCDRSNYVNAGNDPIPSFLDSKRKWQINLNIVKEIGEENLDTPVPVVHYLELGPLPGQNTEVPIQINIYESARTDKKPKGSVTVSSAAANEKSRPVEMKPLKG